MVFVPGLLLLLVAMFLVPAFLVVSHAQAKVEEHLGEPVDFSDVTMVDGGSLAIGFAAEEGFLPLRYYYLFGDGRIMMRVGEQEMMIRSQSKDERAAETDDGTSSGSGEAGDQPVRP